MKINGNLSILVSKECTRIEIKDSDAGTRFLSIKLDPETFCALLGRLAEVPVELNIKELNKVGKKMEIDRLEFYMHIIMKTVMMWRLWRQKKPVMMDG